jgi:hypothetical protein
LYLMRYLLFIEVDVDRDSGLCHGFDLAAKLMN